MKKLLRSFENRNETILSIDTSGIKLDKEI